MSFEIGQTVVYPHHGAAKIEEISTRMIRGEEKTYLTLRVSQGDLSIQVPAENVDLVGVRDVVDEDGLETVLSVLRAPYIEEPTNWSRRFKANQEKIATGDIVKVAEVVRDLTRRDDQKKLFEGAKVNDVITFNPSEAHGETELAALLKLDKEEAAKHTGKFTFQVSSISRFVPASYDQELFDRVFEPGTVKSEEEMRAKVKELIQSQYNQDADMKFLIDVRKYTEEKVGKLEFPEALLKRFMKLQNADKGEEFVEKNFEKSLEELRWHLIKEQLVEANKVTIDQKDVKEAALQTARIQFAQYGLTNVPEEYLENYANEMLKDRNQMNAFVDRSVNTKLAAALKEVVKLEHKSISFEDFAKFFEAENAE